MTVNILSFARWIVEREIKRQGGEASFCPTEEITKVARGLIDAYVNETTQGHKAGRLINTKK